MELPEMMDYVRRQVPVAGVIRDYPVTLPSGQEARAYYSWGRGRNVGRHYFHCYYKVPLYINGVEHGKTTRHFVQALDTGEIKVRE